MDKNELKVQALLERVSNLTAEYENKVADLRVELTMLSQEVASLRDGSSKSDASVEGVVVDD